MPVAPGCDHINQFQPSESCDAHKVEKEQLTVIVPTLNEASNIRPLLTKIFEQNSPALEIEVLIVDDGSTDGTCERVLFLGKTQSVRLLRRRRPVGGLAGAVVAGALMASSRWIVVMDADLSHPPDRIGDLLAPLLDRSQDLVIGSRYAPGGRHSELAVVAAIYVTGSLSFGSAPCACP